MSDTDLANMQTTPSDSQDQLAQINSQISQVESMGNKPGFWDKFVQNAAPVEAAYPYLNQFMMGLPDYVISKIPAAQQAFGQTIGKAETEYPGISKAANITGIPGSLAYGGPEAKLFSGALGKLGLKGAAKLAGTEPVQGIGRNIMRGVLQAAPQTIGRTLTGNITPEQGALGLAGGGALGGIAGALGGRIAPQAAQAAGGSSPLANTVNKWLLGSSGIRIADEKGPMTFGIPSKFIRSRLQQARSLGDLTANTVADNRLYTEKAIDNWHNTQIAPVFKAMDKAWSDMGIDAPVMKGILDDVTQAASADNPALEGVYNLMANNATKWNDMQTDLINLANRGKGLPEIQNYLRKYAYRNTRDLEPTQQAVAENQADAAKDIMGHLEQGAINKAVQDGTLNPGDVERAQMLWPVDRILSNKEFREGLKTQYVSPGSPTFEKFMLGAGLGSGSVLGADQRPITPAKILEDVALGSVAGNVALPALTKLVNAGTARGAGALNRLLRGSGGATAAGASPAVGTALTGAERAAPGLVGSVPGTPVANEAQQNTNNPIAQPAIDHPPTMQELMTSDNPYLRMVGQRLSQSYGGDWALKINPQTGQHYTPDDIASIAYQQTNGFEPQESAAILASDPQGYQELKDDMQVARAVNDVDWNNLEKWYGSLWSGGRRPIEKEASAVGAPGAVEADRQLNALLMAAKATPDMENQIKLILRQPGLTLPERKDAVLQVLSTSKGVFQNRAVLQSLGLL